jgi:hypothetical protein
MTTLVDRQVVEDDVDLTLAAHTREEALEEGHEGSAVVLLDGCVFRSIVITDSGGR